MTEDSLRALLAAHGVPFATWGQGKAKTLTHLLQELERGECHFEPAQADFPLVRQVEGVRIDVFYDAPSGRQRLIEESVDLLYLIRLTGGKKYRFAKNRCRN